MTTFIVIMMIYMKIMMMMIIEQVHQRWRYITVTLGT